MLILVGHTRSKEMLRIIKRQGFGRMFVDAKPDPFEGEQWGFDNMAFGLWLRGQPFDEDAYAQRFQRAYETGMPYMAVVPDIVAKGMESLDYSLGWAARLPRRWPWYLAVQDGMEESEVAKVLYMFDGLFLGGTDRFKGTAYRWSRIAHEQGKRFHYGRAGTLRKLQAAYNSEADSCDSAFPLWTMERMVKFCGFNNDMRKQLTLEN